jgi:hypothetical protein
MIGHLGQRIDHIQSSLTVQDLVNLKLTAGGLLRESEAIGRSGQESSAYDRELQNLQAESGKWVALAEEVCRLNWFITLRQALRRQNLA